MALSKSATCEQVRCLLLLLSFLFVGSCLKRLLLRRCGSCQVACSDLSEDAPVRFLRDEPRPGQHSTGWRL